LARYYSRETGHQPVYDDTANRDAEPASVETFTMFANVALDRALSERFARWGTDFIDPNSMTEPRDRNGASLGVRIYEAYRCKFNLIRQSNTEMQEAKLALTVDLKAKVTRTASVLDNIYNDNKNRQLTDREIDEVKRKWLGETVITTHDRKCYFVIDLLFHDSANSLKIPEKEMSHTEYFESKGHKLKYPDAKPMVAVQGRRNMTIFFPAEMVAGNELDIRVKEKLPSVASFSPTQRNAALEKVTAYLTPGSQKSKSAGGLLPALGIQLSDDGRITASARVLPLPAIVAAGVLIPGHKGENWAPMLTQAKFKVEPREATVMNVVLVCNNRLTRGAPLVYNRIRDMVNTFNSKFRFGDNPFEVVEAGTSLYCCWYTLYYLVVSLY
jgi:hypothetical protein